MLVYKHAKISPRSHFCPTLPILILPPNPDAADSGFVYTADDVLEMSVVRGVRGVGGVCEMCMCLARGGVGGVGLSG